MYFDIHKAQRLMNDLEKCTVFAIVESFNWPEDTKISWHWLEKKNDWCAKLETDHPELKAFWMKLCQSLCNIPDIEIHSHSAFDKAIPIIQKLIN